MTLLRCGTSLSLALVGLPRTLSSVCNVMFEDLSTCIYPPAMWFEEGMVGRWEQLGLNSSGRLCLSSLPGVSNSWGARVIVSGVNPFDAKDETGLH